MEAQLPQTDSSCFNGILENIVEKEIDMKFYDNYFYDPKVKTYSCKRISYCSCNCDDSAW